MAPRGTVTNQLLQTDGLILSPWAFTNLPSNTPNQADPLGGARATAFTESVDAGTSHITYGTALSTALNQRIIVSVYFKAGARSCFALAPGAATCYVNFDSVALTAGTVSGPVLGYGIEQVQGAPGWVRAWVVCNVAFAEMRYYVTSTSAGLNYTGTGAVAATFFGAMVEIAVPGQTTPSPYVASGATSGVGPRDTRQNLLRGSDSPSFTYYSPSTGDSIATGITDPDGGSTAIAYTYGTATASYAYLSQTVAGLDASKVWTLSMWLRVASGTKALSLCLSNLTIATVYKAITVTTKWQRFSFTLTEKQLAATASGLGVGLAGATAGDVFQMCRLQLEQANAPGPYVKTTSAPYNPNGAPRSLVL
jgi:hypothetical protein